jgi:hypothetical protein
MSAPGIQEIRGRTDHSSSGRWLVARVNAVVERWVQSCYRELPKAAESLIVRHQTGAAPRPVPHRGAELISFLHAEIRGRSTVSDAIVVGAAALTAAVAGPA